MISNDLGAREEEHFLSLHPCTLRPHNPLQSNSKFLIGLMAERPDVCRNCR
jgi:hypothetical protein